MKPLTFVIALFVLLVSIVGCVAVGKPAPDFTVQDISDRAVRLSDFKARISVVLVFYYAYSWIPCRQQLGELQAHIAEIRELSAEVVAFSTGGSPPDVERTRDALNLTFPLVPASTEHIARRYGVWNPRSRSALATIIVDREGIVRFLHDAGDDEFNRPKISIILQVLREIR
jgi:peroxiredoxin